MYDFIDFENFQVVCKECQKKSVLIKEESLLGNGTDLQKKVILTFKCPECSNIEMLTFNH